MVEPCGYPSCGEQGFYWCGCMGEASAELHSKVSCRQHVGELVNQHSAICASNFDVCLLSQNPPPGWDDFEPSSEPIEMADLIVVEYPDGTKGLADR